MKYDIWTINIRNSRQLHTKRHVHQSYHLSKNKKKKTNILPPFLIERRNRSNDRLRLKETKARCRFQARLDSRPVVPVVATTYALIRRASRVSASVPRVNVHYAEPRVRKHRVTPAQVSRPALRQAFPGLSLDPVNESNWRSSPNSLPPPDPGHGGGVESRSRESEIASPDLRH